MIVSLAYPDICMALFLDKCHSDFSQSKRSFKIKINPSEEHSL